MTEATSIIIKSLPLTDESLSAYRRGDKSSYREIKKEGLRQNEKLFRQLEKAATQFEIKTKRETTILNAFSEIGKDVNQGKNVNKYTIVMFNNRAIVCKNCIHDLILRIFGGRRKGVNAEIQTLLTSQTLNYKTDAFSRRLKDLNYSPENSNVEIEKGIDYYMGFKRYGVSLVQLEEFKNTFDGLITKFDAYYLMDENITHKNPSLSLKLQNFNNLPENI
jgi:hypothetical protein